MISVVICSVKPHLLTQVSESLEKTIGVPYEILSWDNRQTSYGICKVYNMMAEKARYELLLFLHEDVVFTEPGWGGIICNEFNLDKKIGVIGIAGAKYFSKFYTGWFTGERALDFFSVIHRTNGKETLLRSTDSPTAISSEVLCVDGVFIATKKEVWRNVKFNEEKLKGFHFYDIDFSLRASMHYKIISRVDIPLIHITSGGDYGNKWVKEALNFHKNILEKGKWGEVELVDDKIEIRIASRWLDLLKYQPVSIKNRLEWIRAQQLYKFPTLYFGILKFLFYRCSGIGWVHRKLSGKYR